MFLSIQYDVIIYQNLKDCITDLFWACGSTKTSFLHIYNRVTTISNQEHSWTRATELFNDLLDDLLENYQCTIYWGPVPVSLTGSLCRSQSRVFVVDLAISYKGFKIKTYKWQMPLNLANEITGVNGYSSLARKQNVNLLDSCSTSVPEQVQKIVLINIAHYVCWWNWVSDLDRSNTTEYLLPVP